MRWKSDWSAARENLVAWWEGRGLAVAVFAPRREPAAPVEPKPPPATLRELWLDPDSRLARAEHAMATTFFGGEAFPYFDTQIGPGSLGTILGAGTVLDFSTVWYQPCLNDADGGASPRLRLEGNRWLDSHRALIDAGASAARGRYLVGIPDLIEGLDTLAALRGTERLLVDMIDRPAWVHARLAEIHDAYEQVFELLAEPLRDELGGNAYAAFRIWGPGRTAKIQCDAACMLSPAMFREFHVPYCERQCAWLDYAVFHLDGPGAVRHLDALLAIERLRAVQWTPGSGQPGAGDPAWYDLFRRCKAAGKSIHVACTPDQVVPLLDALGPEGTFALCWTNDQDSAEALLEQVAPYRT